MVELILRKVNSLTKKYEYTPLHLAASHGHTSTVKLLLSKGALVDARGLNSHYTPLHFAAGNGHNSTVKLLLSRGASIEAMDVGGKTPLYHATRGGYPDIVRLVGGGAVVDAPRP